MSNLFGINDYQWGRRTQKAMMDAKYGRGADLEHLTAARQNPEQYTMHQPHGGVEPAFTFDDWSSGGIDDNDYDEVIPIYKIPQPEPAAAAPAPEPKREPYKAPEQVGISDKLDNANKYLQGYTRSGQNFESNTLSDREAKTDSFSQKPAYDPNAGVSSPEAGNFLDDYKLDLQKNIKDFRE
jgi:hypothetical protein